MEKSMKTFVNGETIEYTSKEDLLKKIEESNSRGIIEECKIILNVEPPAEVEKSDFEVDVTLEESYSFKKDAKSLEITPSTEGTVPSDTSIKWLWKSGDVVLGTDKTLKVEEKYLVDEATFDLEVTFNKKDYNDKVINISTSVAELPK